MNDATADESQDRDSPPTWWIERINESVHTNDDVDIGDIEATNRNFVVVKRGFNNIHYYYIPFSKVEGWDGHVVWLKITEDYIKRNYERNHFPDPARYYIKNYPGYISQYYPIIVLVPAKNLLPHTQHRVGRYSSKEPLVYRCDLCDTEFRTSDDLSNHVKMNHQALGGELAWLDNGLIPVY